MKEFIDISVSLSDQMPVWPGSSGFNMYSTSQFKPGVCSNNSKIECDVHVGTHIDAPRHFIDDGMTVESISLNKMIGEVYVVDLRNIDVIDRDILAAQSYPPDLKRLLIKTDNSRLWELEDSKFYENYTALTEDGAQWIVDKNIELVGIDYLSIQRFDDPFTTHEILLKHEVVILEGICLSNVDQGCYELLCLPIKIEGADGAPARAILIK